MPRTQNVVVKEILDKTIEKYKPSTSDLDAWADLDNPANDAIVTAKVGLFSSDITDFLENCAADPDNCSPDKYVHFSGWSMGINWASSADVVNKDSHIVLKINADSYRLFKNYWSDDSNNPPLVMAGYMTESERASSTNVLNWDNLSADGLNPFTSWSTTKLNLNTKRFQDMFHFQDDTDVVYFEVGDAGTFWMEFDYD